MPVVAAAAMVALVALQATWRALPARQMPLWTAAGVAPGSPGATRAQNASGALFVL